MVWTYTSMAPDLSRAPLLGPPRIRIFALPNNPPKKETPHLPPLSQPSPPTIIKTPKI